jgi:hypothetical protein
MRVDFAATQTFLQNFVETALAQKKATRNVSAVSNRGRNRGGRAGGAGTGGNKSKGEGRYYPFSEWKKLSPEEQERIRSMRGQHNASTRKNAGGGSSTRGRGGVKRTIYAFRQSGGADDEEEGMAGVTDSELSAQSTNAGNQFGRNAHGATPSPNRKIRWTAES